MACRARGNRGPKAPPETAHCVGPVDHVRLVSADCCSEPITEALRPLLVRLAEGLAYDPQTILIHVCPSIPNHRYRVETGEDRERWGDENCDKLR
jgi:hypothetical protein